MFRHTITFLLIVMILNHDFAAARSIDFPQVRPFQNIEQPQLESEPSEDLEWLDSESDIDEKYLEGMNRMHDIYHNSRVVNVLIDK